MGKLLKVALSLVPRTSSILKCHSIVSVDPCGPGSYITPIITPTIIEVIFISKNGKEIPKNHHFFSFFSFSEKRFIKLQKISTKEKPCLKYIYIY
jgi:hypothetical protein